MLYRIQNFGLPKDVTVNGVKYFISRNKLIETNDSQFAFEASKLRNVEVTELLDEMNYFELRRIAKEYGIEVTRNVKKKELIKYLKKKRGEK